MRYEFVAAIDVWNLFVPVVKIVELTAPFHCIMAGTKHVKRR